MGTGLMTKTSLVTIGLIVGILAGMAFMRLQVFPRMVVESYNGYDYGRQVGKQTGTNDVLKALHDEWKRTGKLTLQNDKGEPVVFVEEKQESSQ